MSKSLGNFITIHELLAGLARRGRALHHAARPLSPADRLDEEGPRGSAGDARPLARDQRPHRRPLIKARCLTRRSSTRCRTTSTRRWRSPPARARQGGEGSGEAPAKSGSRPPPSSASMFRAGIRPCRVPTCRGDRSRPRHPREVAGGAAGRRPQVEGLQGGRPHPRRACRKGVLLKDAKDPHGRDRHDMGAAR